MTTINITEHPYNAATSYPDNTTAIQAALDAAAAHGDTVHIPPGVFRVDAAHGGLQMRSGTSLNLQGILQAIPNAQVHSIILRIDGANHVNVFGPGTLVGERHGHLAPGPDRNEGNIFILNSNNVTVSGGLTTRDSWSDGIMIVNSNGVTINNVLCDNNSRNGMSIISGQGIRVENCVFSNTNAPDDSKIMPQCGIDLEPNFSTEVLQDIVIAGNQFNKNKGAGCWVPEPTPTQTRIYVTNNSFDQHYKDGSGPCIGGQNDWKCNTLYAIARWIPGYDWWLYPKEFST